MENPQEEIADVVHSLTSSATPQSLIQTVEDYFTEDASFNHPLCSVEPRPGSRDAILGIYQWYKIISPIISLNVIQPAFVPENGVIFLDVVQTFHVFWSFLAPHPAHFVVKVTLERDPSDNRYRISRQEDYYQPEDVAYLVIPLLAHLILFFKAVATAFCNIGARILPAFVFWTSQKLEASRRAVS